MLQIVEESSARFPCLGAPSISSVQGVPVVELWPNEIDRPENAALAINPLREEGCEAASYKLVPKVGVEAAPLPSLVRNFNEPAIPSLGHS